MFSTKKKIAAVGVAAIAAASAGIAGAYWTTTGSGQGAGSATTGVNNTLTFEQTALTAMFPGDSSQTLTVKVTNTAQQSVFVGDVAAYLEVTKAGGAPAGTCDATDFLLGNAPAPGTAETALSLAWTDAELDKDEFANATGSIQFNNKGSNQDACKGASVAVKYLAR